MRQYYSIKQNYSDALLLFQVGDFYELFGQDAITAADFLGITLTKRGTDASGKPIELCGVPMHVLAHYLTKLVKGGFKVAICDQLEQAKPGKIVARGVTQVLTPGTLTDLNLLDDKSASYLVAIYPTGHIWTLYIAEVLTGQLYSAQLPNAHMSSLLIELSRFMPDEIIVPQTKYGNECAYELQKSGYYVTHFPVNIIDEISSAQFQQWIHQQLGTQADHIMSTDSSHYGLLLLFVYLLRTNKQVLAQFKQISVYQPEDFLMLDRSTQRNLELVSNTYDGSRKNSLLSVLDRSVTSMGSRMLKKWLLRPLVRQDHIEQRLNAIDIFIRQITKKDDIRTCLKQIGDIERTVGRVSLQRAQLSDYLSLKRALHRIPDVLAVMHDLLQAPDAIASDLLKMLSQKFVDFTDLVTLLERACNEDSEKDWLIKEGYDAELDRLRQLFDKSEQTILALEQREQQATGINSLKIKYNGISGYSIEVTKTNSHLVPDRYMRLQTLTNKERYTTQELRNLEYEMQKATRLVGKLEKDIFESVKTAVAQYTNQLKKLSQALSYLDALTSFAQIAYEYNYVRPQFNQEGSMIIEQGRHPVAENILQESFIPNDTQLDDNQSLWIITGPNMGGKSTYLRQVALIAIMAQMGSFVPACYANLPLIDRIFTRIGAGDNVSAGKSTFLLEMEETALICKQATQNSLVILDEVGRGTSTYDGLAIAQAVLEYIYERVKARCLFATHYHELTELATRFTGIATYHAASVKQDNTIILLHKIVPGIAQGSFGLEVAKVAQLPEPLIKRAEIILQDLRQQTPIIDSAYQASQISPIE